MTEVDPNSFGEAARALLVVFSILFAGGGGYVFGRKQQVKIDPQPLEISPDRLTRLETEWESKHRELAEVVKTLTTTADKNHENIFARLTAAEKAIAEMKGQIPHINQAVHRIETKLDNLIARISHGPQ